MRYRIQILLTVMCCSLLSSTDVFSTDYKGEGYEGTEQRKFTSVTTFSDAGLRTAETRLYVDELGNTTGKSITTFNLRGQEMLRTYYSPDGDGGWNATGEQIIFNYNSNRQLSEVTKKNADGIVKSFLLTYDKGFSEMDSIDYLSGWYEWDPETQNYKTRFSFYKEHEISTFDEQDRVISSKYTIRYGDEFSYEIRYYYNEENGEVAREEFYEPDGEDILLCTVNEYTYYPGTKNLKTLSLFDYDYEQKKIVPCSKYEYEYDENDNMTLEVYYEWEESDFVYYDEWQYEYNAMGKETQADYFQQEEGVKTHKERTVISYNEKGLETDRKLYSINNGEPSLLSEGSTTYDEFDRIIMQTDCYGRKGTHTYDGNNETISLFDKQDPADEQWTEINREVYERDSAGRITLYEYYTINYYNSTLERQTRNETYYDDSNNAIFLSTFFNDFDLDEEYDVESFFSFDDNGDLNGKAFKTVENDSPRGIMAEYVSFDEKGTPADRVFGVGNDSETIQPIDSIAYVSVPSEIKHAEINTIVRGGIGRIEVSGTNSKRMQIVGTSGMILYNGTAASVCINPGLYVVEIDGNATKVVVR